ncbi:hypothetical protein Leryth_002630 [Lithospermum erythrorhizon]|nr:hypothetical protein Leryth_002630 [Lithospermum erythrorhizon]
MYFQKMGKKVKNDEHLQSSCKSNENDRSYYSGKQGKRQRLWKQIKYQLVEFHSLPDYLKDNEYIIRHYRSEWPFKQLLFSIFTIHNETLNVWTHLIGFFLFLSLTIYSSVEIPRAVDHSALQNFQDASRKALLTCLPSLPHMPNLHRFPEDLKNSTPSLDLFRSLSSMHDVELLTNCLPDSFTHSNHSEVSDLVILHQFSDLQCHIGLVSRAAFYFFQIHEAVNLIHSDIPTWPLVPISELEYRLLRTGLFFGMSASGLVPILHKLILFWDQPEVSPRIITEAELYGYILCLGSISLCPDSRFTDARKLDYIAAAINYFMSCRVGRQNHYRKPGIVYLGWRILFMDAMSKQ